MKRAELVGIMACSLLFLLLAKLWAHHPAAEALGRSPAWEYRVVLLSELQDVKDENNDVVNDTNEASLSRHLNQKINELGKDRWEFVQEHNGWLDYWLFRKPINP